MRALFGLNVLVVGCGAFLREKIQLNYYSGKQ